MKKILIGTLGVSLLSATAMFAQNSSTTSTDTNTMSGTSTKKHHKKHSKSRAPRPPVPIPQHLRSNS